LVELGFEEVEIRQRSTAYSLPDEISLLPFMHRSPIVRRRR